MTNASLAPKDGDNAEPWTPYCEGSAIQFSAPNWALGLASACETDDPARRRPFVYALPGHERRRRAGLRRWLEHRHLGEVGTPRPRQEGARDHPERRVPDDLRRERPHPRQEVARVDARRHPRGAGVHRGCRQRQAHPGVAELGRGRGIAHPRGLLREDRSGRRRADRWPKRSTPRSRTSSTADPPRAPALSRHAPPDASASTPGRRRTSAAGPVHVTIHQEITMSTASSRYTARGLPDRGRRRPRARLRPAPGARRRRRSGGFTPVRAARRPSLIALAS